LFVGLTYYERVSSFLRQNHQKGMRSRTLNVTGIVGLGEACRLKQLEMLEDEKAIALLRDKLQ
jgi:cysteine desulfurase